MSFQQESKPRVTFADEQANHNVFQIAGLDWERDGWRMSINGSPAVRVPKSELLQMPLSDVDYVVVEQAHMRERGPYSVAQVYEMDELKQLPFRHKIKLFPSMPGQLAKAAVEVGNVRAETNEHGSPLPDKDKDAETIAAYSLNNLHKVVGWKKFKLPDEDESRHLWEARDKLRDDIRLVLNPLRVAWNSMPTAKRYDLPVVKEFVQKLEDSFDKLPAGVKDQFGIRKTRNGLRVDRMSAAITLYVACYDEDGELRRNPQGDFIGVNFIMKAIGMCNSYKPNMARSQLTYHGLRHYKGTRTQYMKNLKDLIRALRDSE